MNERAVRRQRRQGRSRLRRATDGVLLAGLVLLAASARGGLGLDDLPYILSVAGITLVLALLLEGAAAAALEAPGRARVLGTPASLALWILAGIALVLSLYVTAEVLGTPSCAPGVGDTGAFLPSCIERPIRDRLDTLFVDGVAALLIVAAMLSAGGLRLIRPLPRDDEQEAEVEEQVARPAVSLASIHAAAMTARLQRTGSYSVGTWRD